MPCSPRSARCSSRWPPTGWPELSAPISLESLPYQVARVVDPVDAEFMGRRARYRSGRLA